MAQWRSTTGYDLASVGSYYNWTFPTDYSFLVVNNTNAAATYTHSNTVDLNNVSVPALTLPPFTSKVLITSIPLPVTYLAPLQGYAVPSMGIELRWATTTERDAARFDIQRSTDGVSFEKIGQLAAHGTSSHPLNYRFWDKHPTPGKNYYRLRQVDFDEKSALSNIVALDWKSFEINVFPNPATGIFEIKSDFVWERALLRNALGQVVQTFSYAENTTLDGLPDGVYSLEIFEVNNGVPVVLPLIKQ